MSVARKILWNTFSQILGKVIIAGLGIVTVKLLTSYLGKEGYGEYTTAFEFLAFFAIVADLGLYTIGVREMAKDEKKIPYILGNVMTIRTALCFIMAAMAIVAGSLIPQYQGTPIPIGIALVAANMVLTMMTSTVSTVLQVHLKMEYNSLASVIGKGITLAYIVLVIFVLHPDAKVDGFYHVIIAGIIGNGVMLLTTYYYSRKYAHITYRFDKAFFKDVLLKALPYGIALVLNNVYFRIGSILLSLMKSSSDVAIYGVPMRILEAMGIIPLYFMNAVLPVLTRSLQRKDGSHQKIIQYAFDFLVLGSMPIVAGILVLAYPVIALISTPEFLSNLSAGFYGSDVALQILIFALAFSFINSLFGFILVADNRQTKLLSRNAIGAVLTVILNLVLIPYFGVRGAAFANVVTELYIMLASYFIAKHYIGFKIDFSNFFKILLSSVVMGVVVFLLKDPTYALMQNKNLIVLIPVGGIVYLAMLFVTKTINKEMLSLLKKPKNASPAVEETV